MVRAPALLLFLAVAGCGDDSAPGPPAEQPRDKAAAEPIRTAPAEPTEEEKAGSADAAAVLRSYYALIERGDYQAAVDLRSDDRTDARRMADNFKAYERYDAQIGRASRPVRAGDWLYVDVPVMITGSFKGGRTFGNAGRVTMRRTVSDEAGDSGWRVYTG